MERYELYCEKEDGGKRIDGFLSLTLEDISRNRIQRLISEGNILVNGKAVSKSFKLKSGDIVTVVIPEAKEAEISAEDIPLDIIYEDSDVIVINKSQGMVVHPAPGHYSGTVVNALMYHCRGELSGINGVNRPGIVHRIDRDTSGVIVAAKNDFAHNALAAQLAEHSMTRIYKGIVYNNFKEEEGTVDANLGRSPKDRKKMAVLKTGGRKAVTHYRVLENLGKYTYAEFKLETGRTHQIRVHMSYIGHPLLGDVVYGPKKCPYSLKGQTLHAGVLGFIHPRSGEYVEFSAPLPSYFQDLINRLGGKQ
ncbi:MAG: RluA family pseudouridine synthase [Clostridiales bacterium]|nr:RluA family pseudouridine synthase [Clostridiales bacterium]